MLFALFGFARLRCDAIYWQPSPSEDCGKPRSLMYSLIRREWIRVGLAVALVAMAAFCAFETYLLVYSNTSGVVSVAQAAKEFQNRANKYAWAGSLLEVAAALVLVPLFPLREDEAGHSIFLQVLTRYLPAIVISTVGTAALFSILIWIFKTFPPA